MTMKLPTTKEYLRVRSTLIKKVFPSLRRQNSICARGNFANTQTSAIFALSEQCKRRGKSCGLVFWTTQENDRFREGGRVILYISHSDDSPSSQQIIDVGRAVVAECKENGLTVDWNGKANQAIEVSL